MKKLKNSCPKSCQWYHEPIKFLKEVGLVSQIDKEFFIPALLGSLRSTRPRILVTGVADEEMVRIILEVLEKNEFGGEIFAIDLCFTPLRKIRRLRAKNLKVKAKVASVFNLPFPKSFFDLVVTDDILSWFPDQKKKRVVEQWMRVLAKNGTIITTVRIGNFYNKINCKRYIQAIIRGIFKGYSPLKSRQILKEYQKYRKLYPLAQKFKLKSIFDKMSVFCLSKGDKWQLVVSKI